MRPMKNSDILYHNLCEEEIESHLYTSLIRSYRFDNRVEFKKNPINFNLLQKQNSSSSIGQDKGITRCGHCGYEQEKKFFSWLSKSDFSHCHFCLTLMCQKCNSKRKTVIPYQIWLNNDFGQYHLCKAAYFFMQEYRFLRILKHE